jgi:hypothetical protein
LFSICLDNNPELFRDEEKTSLFILNLRNATASSLSLNFCQLPGQALTALFQAVSSNDMLNCLNVYDLVQLDGLHLERLLDIIAQMPYLLSLHINLDFALESVMSSIHRNSSILSLCDGEEAVEVADSNDEVAKIMNRNDRMTMADELLQSEPQCMTPLGLWAHGLASITDDDTGATAAYKILQEKLVMRWLPARGLSPVAAAAAAATTFAAAAAPLPAGPSLNPCHDAAGATSAAVALAVVSSLSESVIGQGFLGEQNEMTGINDTGPSSSTASTSTTTKSADKRPYKQEQATV